MLVLEVHEILSKVLGSGHDYSAVRQLYEKQINLLTQVFRQQHNTAKVHVCSNSFHIQSKCLKTWNLTCYSLY